MILHILQLGNSVVTLNGYPCNNIETLTFDGFQMVVISFVGWILGIKSSGIQISRTKRQEFLSTISGVVPFLK
jgi:hypothetical protein